MEKNTKIENLTQENLVNLLCTATYGSGWLAIHAPVRKGVVVNDEDCMEDVWAKALLAGNKIVCTDYYAEGEHYGDNEDYTIGKEDEECEYRIGLQDIIDGLQKCADGTFKVNAESERRWMAKCFQDFADDNGDMDIVEADGIMQVILFGELIYG